MTVNSHFDVEGPLPTGTAILEASAGTGKTYTIARLVSRFVAEGHARMDELLVVSFSEASSRELRDRVRSRLIHDRDASTGVIRDRLAQALAEFDGATVTTTHGFCYAMLRELGTAVDHDLDAVLIEDPHSITADVIDDLYVRKWGLPGAQPAPLEPQEFRELAQEVTRDAVTRLVPEPGEGGAADSELRARIATAVRLEVARRLRSSRLLTYEDMITRLDAALSDEHTANVAIGRLRARYPFVLVDEFQDTDPVQWRILRTAFHEHSVLVLVGDPKQAIYGFRGADVEAYLEARRAATSVATLPRNYRSDPGVLEGLAALLNGAALGDPAITVPSVSPAFTERMLDTDAPVRLRIVPRDGHPLTSSGEIKTEAARTTIRDDVARETVKVLGMPLRQRNGMERTITPGDVAVVVRSNFEAERIRDRLRAAGIPAVVSGRSSIFTVDAAKAWQDLLDALAQPHSTGQVGRLAVSPFIGWSASRLVEGTDALAFRLHQWLPLINDFGVGALFERVQADTRLQERLLQQPDGERLLTDLRHLAEVLHEEQTRNAHSVTQLATWLWKRRTEHDDGGVERSRRLESDAAAVQVLTSHMSKGLEFPVVLAPSLWDHRPRPQNYPRFHDGGERLRDVGGPSGPNHVAHVQANKEEDANEELRVAYVTLTRAAALLILWWAPTQNSSSGPLTRILMNNEAGRVAPWSMQVPSDRDVLAQAQNRAAASRGALQISVVSPPSTASSPQWRAPQAPLLELSLASFARSIDQEWRRTSYTALTQHQDADPSHVRRPFTDDLDAALKDDERDVDGTSPLGVAADDPDGHLHQDLSRWKDLSGGMGFGTLVHRVLEQWEPGCDLAELIARTSPGYGHASTLSDALQLAVDTPLGPIFDNRSWSTLPRTDQLREMPFEIPLAGGDATPDGHANLAGLAELWRQHVPEGVLAEYADVLEELTTRSAVRVLRGYLTGSIDAVLRTQTGSRGYEKYVIVDHKTNRLAPREVPLSAWHYRQDALEAAMVEAHYPLQAVLYSVALHRYLRWRRPDYDPDHHLGGVVYLFLRGMHGPKPIDHAGSPPGVFTWQPPARLITDFSDLLAGRIR
jgi:exodeoxyribonuclease V beta subunit